MRDEQPKYSQKGVRTFGVNPASVQNHELRTVCLRGTDGRVRFAQRGVPDADEILEPLG